MDTPAIPPKETAPAKPRLAASIGPHIRSGETVEKIMWTVSASLVPAAALSVYYFGIPALLVLAVSIASCVFFEAAHPEDRGWQDNRGRRERIPHRAPVRDEPPVGRAPLYPRRGFCSRNNNNKTAFRRSRVQHIQPGPHCPRVRRRRFPQADDHMAAAFFIPEFRYPGCKNRRNTPCNPQGRGLPEAS